MGRDRSLAEIANREIRFMDHDNEHTPQTGQSVFSAQERQMHGQSLIVHRAPYR